MLIPGLEKEKVIGINRFHSKTDKEQPLWEKWMFPFSSSGRHSHLVINLGKEASTPKLQ